MRCTPAGWTPQRIDEYFKWALAVVNGLRGTNKYIEDELDLVFIKKGLLVQQS